MSVRSSRRRFILLLALIMPACNRGASTPAELETRARQAVNQAIQAQGVYSLMESSVAQQIACGHVQVAGSQPRDQDFVYRDSRVILDDSEAFDAAAQQCDQDSRAS